MSLSEIVSTFPYGHAADTFSRSYLLIAIPFSETKVEDALLLLCEMADDKLDDVGHALVFILCIRRLPCRCSLHAESRFLMADALQALVANARQQVAFLGVGHQHRPPTQQSLKDVADHILALLLVVEHRARYPQHLGVVLLEQPLDIVSFHHVFL